MGHMHCGSDESIKRHLYMPHFSVLYLPLQLFKAGFTDNMFQLTCVPGRNIRRHTGFDKLLRKELVLFIYLLCYLSPLLCQGKCAVGLFHQVTHFR